MGGIIFYADSEGSEFLARRNDKRNISMMAGKARMHLNSCCLTPS
jgi:hypothetical protein